MSIERIIKENINKLINESINSNVDGILDNIFSKMDYQIDMETKNLHKKERYYEEVKRLTNIYKEEIQELGLQFSSIDVESNDETTEISYRIQGSEQWSEDDYWNVADQLRSFDNNDGSLPYYYIDETFNLENHQLSVYKIVLSIPVVFE